MRSGRGWLVLLLTAAACRGRGTPAGAGEPVAGDYDQAMSGVSTTLTTDSSHRSHVVAESAFVRQQAREIRFRRIGVTLFDRQGGQAGVLTAERGVYALERGTIEVRGKVLFVTLAGDSLSTAHLIYDQRAMRLRGDTTFVYSTRAGAIRGDSFSTDLSMRGVIAGRRPDQSH